VIEKEMSCNSSDVVEHCYGFNSFLGVIDGHSNLFMDVDRRRVTLHKINGPFAKRTCIGDRVKRR
jgi:hypothetical protein